MKSIKFFALAIGAIALLPSVSLADNVNATNQSANLNSTTFGSSNVTVQDVKQQAINLQNSIKGCKTGTPCATPDPTPPKSPCDSTPCSTPHPTPETPCQYGTPCAN
jgi:hypothetical protein